MLVCSPSSTSRTTRRFVISCGGNRSNRETKKPKKADLADNAKIQESKVLYECVLITLAVPEPSKVALVCNCEGTSS